MVPTNDGATAVRDFYDHLAGDYDRMTGFEKRFVAERPFFKLLVDTHGIRTAVDAGAGTGFHSLLLSELGVRVSAVDASPAMLEALRRNARLRGLEVETIQSTFADAAGRLGKHDAVFCMGNTLAHILTGEDLLAVLAGFRSLLEPGGILFVQMLNYAKILAERDRIQSVKEEGGTIFLRFYDFDGELIRFNILTMTRTPSGFDTQLQSVPLRPWREEDIRPSLEGAGFSSTRVFGAVSMVPFIRENSRDLVVMSTS